MKALILSHSSAVENMGGAELTLLHMIDEWRAHRPDIAIVVASRTPEGQLQPELARRGVPCETIDFDSWVLPVVREKPAHRILTDIMDSRAVRSIMSMIEEHRPDVVITNTIVSPWGALAAKFVGVPHVWFVHEYGDLDHGLDFRIGRDSTFDDIALLSELVVANSETMRDHLRQWIPDEKLTIAYPAIALDRILSRPPVELDLRSDAPLRVVLVGRLSATKGHWRLLRAIARLRDEGTIIHADLVGGSNAAELERIRQHIEELDIAAQVTIVGEQTDPFAFVERAHVGIMASDFEAFGRVTVEYMALGRAVIAADTGANRELVEDDATGWIFERDGEESLIAALRAAHEDRAALARRSEAARHRAVEQIARKWPLREAIDRIEQVVAEGPQPILRLPNVTRDRLAFPRIVDQYVEEQNALRATVAESSTWRIGRSIERVLRPALPLARRVRRRLRRTGSVGPGQ